MKLIIGADLVSTPSNSSFFVTGNIEEIIDRKILELLNNADYRIFNLEVPLTDDFSPIEKAGPVLSSPTATIKGIKKLGVDFVTLANNHIYDHGEEGVKSTIKLLKDNNISYAGVGDFENAHSVHFFEHENIKIGVYCCCEHEFSIVTKEHIGANPFDPLESIDHISRASQQCDHLIVLYHGGREHYRYPSPNLQKVCRKIVDKGASLVVCQHSHCVGCKEDYKGSTIIYGQGNFLFDLRDNEYWNSALLLEVEASKENLNISYHPINKEGKSIKIGDSAIIEQFTNRSKEIISDDFIELKYKSLVQENIDYLLFNICGKNQNSFMFKAINRLSRGRYKKKLATRYFKRNKNRLINYLDCEAYNELILYGLKKCRKD